VNIPSFNTKALSETATALATNRTDDAQTVSFSFDANRTDDAQTQFRDVSFEATNGTNTTNENATTEAAITDDAQTQFRDVSFKATNGTNTNTENATTETSVISFEATNGTNTTIENATTETAIQTRLETPQKLGKKHNKNEKVFEVINM
jgi:hypothetical protein